MDLEHKRCRRKRDRQGVPVGAWNSPPIISFSFAPIPDPVCWLSLQWGYNAMLNDFQTHPLEFTEWEGRNDILFLHLSHFPSCWKLNIWCKETIFLTAKLCYSIQYDPNTSSGLREVCCSEATYVLKCTSMCICECVSVCVCWWGGDQL